MKKNGLKRGTILGLSLLFIGMSITPSINARGPVDPDQSFVTLTGELTSGVTTCPAQDGFPYRYVKVTCKDAEGNPICGIPASGFHFTVSDAGAQWYGALSCIFTAVDQMTNANGEIRFELVGGTSIVGSISIRATVNWIPLNDIDILKCKSVDLDLNGVLGASDFSLFSRYWFSGSYAYSIDFNWDGRVSPSDFSVFGYHLEHDMHI
jgi:hypothetical protein